MGKKVVQHIRQSSVLTGQQIVCFNICQCFNAFPDALGAVIERLFNALFVGVLGLLDAFLELPPCFTVSCFFTAQLCTCSHTHALTATPLQTSPIHTSPPPKKSSLPPIMLRYIQTSATHSLPDHHSTHLQSHSALPFILPGLLFTSVWTLSLQLASSAPGLESCLPESHPVSFWWSDPLSAPQFLPCSCAPL